METKQKDQRLAEAFKSLRIFVNQRPGFETANYGSYASYRSDYRRTYMDKCRAMFLLLIAELPDSQRTWEELQEATRAYMGRLTVSDDGREWSYCAGQYWPTEYRQAAVAVLQAYLGIKA